MTSLVKNLTDDQLIAATRGLVNKESRLKARLIEHLMEVRRRRLFLDLGYSSMFKYCVEGLGIDEAPTWLRLQVASAAEEVPLVLEELREGRISLSVAALLAPVVTPQNSEELCKKVRGLTKRKAEEVLVRYRPKKSHEPSIRKAPSTRRNQAAALDLSEPAKEDTSRASRTPSRAELEISQPERYNLKCSINKQLKDKIDRLAEVLGVDRAHNEIEKILDVAVEHALEARDPVRKEARKQRREARKTQTKKPSKPKNESDNRGNVVTRRIPADVKAEVMKDAGYHCQYRGSNGRQCSERTHLEIDHIRPWGMGGGHNRENLRLVCRSHNQHKMMKDFAELRPGRG